jgi:predicted nucleotidyltransferase
VPSAVTALAADLAALPGVVAVALGGSRATGAHRPDSDWDLGLYYRGAFDPDDLRGLGLPGHVSAMGEWGPIVNGGAWLTVGDTPVDVLYRDLDVIERWHDDARQGRFEILAQNGYLAGAPTYLPVGELAIAQPLAGELPRPTFPDALAATASERWTARAALALMFASTHTDAVARTGMLANAILCAAHARLAARREWVLNEKRLVERAGLHDTQALLAAPHAVARVSAALGIEPLSTR